MKSEAIKEGLKMTLAVLGVIAIFVLVILGKAVTIRMQNERTREIIRQELDRAPE